MQRSLFDEQDLVQQVDGETRVCIKCEGEFKIEFFPIDAYHANGDVRRRPECVDCRKKAQKQTRELHKTAPPVTVDHVCPVCLRNSDEIRGTNHPSHNSWCLDHDHETGLFRGWLCHQCNRMLGIAKDSVQTLERAIKYLKDTSSK